MKVPSTVLNPPTPVAPLLVINFVSFKEAFCLPAKLIEPTPTPLKATALARKRPEKE